MEINLGVTLKNLYPILISMLLLPSLMGQEKKADPVVDIAVNYFTALIGGDLETANSLVGVPYSFDRKVIIKTIDEVKARHEKVIGDGIGEDQILVELGSQGNLFTPASCAKGGHVQAAEK